MPPLPQKERDEIELALALAIASIFITIAILAALTVFFAVVASGNNTNEREIKPVTQHLPRDLEAEGGDHAMIVKYTLPYKKSQ